MFENLSRFSRSGNRKTMQRIEQILDAGIQIHIAEDDLILMEADDLDNLDFSILANVKNFGNKDYTNKLTREIRSVKKSQREEIRTNGRVFTSLMPAWLKTEGRIYNMGKLVATGKIVPVTEAEGTGKDRKIPVSVVREIFHMAALGYGSPRILKELNGRGQGLSRTWISKLLNNRAVLGEFQPCKMVNGKQVPDGALIVDTYYPRIISDAEWNDARRAVDAKNYWDSDKRKISFQNRRQNDWSLFGKIVRDVTDGNAVNVWFDKCGGNKNPVIRNPDVSGRRVRYDFFEKAVRAFIRHNIDWRSAISSGVPQSLQDSISTQTKLTDSAATLRSQIANQERAIATAEPSAAIVLARVVSSLDAKLVEVERDLAEVTNRVDAERMKLRALEGYEKLDELLDAPSENREAWSNLKIAISRIVQNIDINWYCGEALEFYITLINGFKTEYVEMNIKTGGILVRATSTDGQTFYIQVPK